MGTEWAIIGVSGDSIYDVVAVKKGQWLGNCVDIWGAGWVKIPRW